MRYFLQLAMAASLVVTGLTSCSTPSPRQLAFPKVDVEITRPLFPELTQKLDDHQNAGRKIIRPTWAFPRPAYPRSKKAKGAQGTVLAAFVVNESGRAQDIHILSKCPQPLQEVVGKALAAGHGQPMTVDGKPLDYPLTCR